MQKNGTFRLLFLAVSIAMAGAALSAPPPIKRGPLIGGPRAKTEQAKPAAAKPKAAAKPIAEKPKTKTAAKPAKPRYVAEKPKATEKPARPSLAPRAPYRGAIAVDADTGRVLFADNERTAAYPASITKLMTFLLVLEDIKAGAYKLGDRVEASALAASMEPSSVGLRAGQSMTVHDLLLSIMVKSANDAAEALAEHSASKTSKSGKADPDELRAAFVERMNRKAQALGMRDTRYASPNGLPPPSGSKRGFDVSTAADLVKLGQAVARNPKALEYTSRPQCKVTDGSGKPLTLVNHNYFIPGNPDPKHLCAPVEGCDGLKTGFTAASGSSIMLTARRNGRRVIAVVLGSAGRHEREKAAESILRDALGAISVW